MKPPLMITVRSGLATLMGALSLAGASPAAAQQREDGILGDDFARDAGTIVVTGERPIGRDLFEPVELPESSCLVSAPEIGAEEPGFTIDASGLKKISQLERLRKRTRAGTIFVSGGSFVGQKVRDAQLYDMCFFGTDFSQTDWTGFSGSGIGFVDSDLTGARMAGTVMPFVLLRDSKLAEVDARQARWTNGQIDGGWEGSVRNLDLSGADLTGFRIECGTDPVNGCPTEREGMSLAGANLRRASFFAFYWPQMNLDGATIDQTELSLDHLPYLPAAQLVGPVVLRSPRRAIMLFPTEARALAETGLALDRANDPCASGPTGALAVACQVPGSDTAALLGAVIRLEGAAANSRGYAGRRNAWLASRDACLDLADDEAVSACVLAAYRAREEELRGATGGPAWLDSEGYRLFLSSEAAFPTASDNPGLYGRVLPIMLDTAVAALIVRIDARGRIDAKGVTEGGCSFESANLFYDPRTDTISIPARSRRRAAGEPLIAFTGSDAEVRPEGLERLGACAGESDFPRLRALRLGEQMLADIYARF